jgi:hypothetical protein
MKNLLPLFFAGALWIYAADFWQSKPYTEWNEKEVQKLLTSSPWAKEVSLAMPAGGGSGSGKGGGRRGGGGGDASGDVPLTGPATGNGGGNAGSNAGIREVGGAQGGGGSAPVAMVTISWRTALPLREAAAKQKYGADTATSPDAKKLVEEEQKYYAVLVSGLPGRMGRSGDEMKAELLKSTTLAVKGKEPIVATDLQAGGSEQKAAVMFLFPKTAAIDADDKEVEFTTRLGPMVLKTKFKLKEMVFNGKLEL